MLEDKRRVAEIMTQRDQILQRKNELGDKISDIMNFVSNSENLWELLGHEKDWEDLDLTEGTDKIFNLIVKDHFQLEKMRLKKDAEILNLLIVVQSDGSVFGRKEFLPLMHSKMVRSQHENDGSSSEEADSEEESKEEHPFASSPPG